MSDIIYIGDAVNEQNKLLREQNELLRERNIILRELIETIKWLK